MATALDLDQHERRRVPCEGPVGLRVIRGDREGGDVEPLDRGVLGHGGAHAATGSVANCASATAASMCDRWVSACGKFPSITPFSGENSSEKRPRSLAVAIARSNA